MSPTSRGSVRGRLAARRFSSESAVVGLPTPLRTSNAHGKFSFEAEDEHESEASQLSGVDSDAHGLNVPSEREMVTAPAQMPLTPRQRLLATAVATVAAHAMQMRLHDR